MDGASDDMRDGTPKNEATELWEVGREGEIEPPHSLATDGLEHDPLANSMDDE